MVAMIKKRFIPDIKGRIIPGIAAAGILIGSKASDLLNKIGEISWYDVSNMTGAEINKILNTNDYWIGEKYDISMHRGLRYLYSLIYRNGIVQVDINPFSNVIYCVRVNEGYQGKFYDIGLGDSINKLNEIGFPNYFSPEEMFLLAVYLDENKTEPIDIAGILFGTDYGQPLDLYEEQTIITMFVNNFSLNRLPKGLYDDELNLVFCG